jgi:phosphomannomutase
MNVIDVGMIDTSFIYFAINHLDAVGGIRPPPRTIRSNTTASKSAAPRPNPSARPAGSMTSSASPAPCAWAKPACTGKSRKQRPLGRNTKARAAIPELKRPLKVVIDASNGMAGKMVPAIFGGVPQSEDRPHPFRDHRKRSRTSPIRWSSQSRHAEAKRCLKKSPTWASASTATPTAACFWMKPAK